MELIDQHDVHWNSDHSTGQFEAQVHHQQHFYQQQQRQQLFESNFRTSSKFPSGMQLPLQFPAVESAIGPCSAWESCQQSYSAFGGGMQSYDGIRPLHDLRTHMQHLHPTSIARRNERERNRVKTINSTFSKLRAHLPCSSSSKSKKLSKVQILRSAIQYINQLAGILKAQDGDGATPIVQVSQNEEVTSTSRDEDSSEKAEEEECSDIDKADDDDDMEGDAAREEHLRNIDWLQ